MRVQRKEIKKPNSERIRYALTEITEAEYITICKGLYSRTLKDDKEAAKILSLLEEVAEISTAKLFY